MLCAHHKFARAKIPRVRGDAGHCYPGRFELDFPQSRGHVVTPGYRGVGASAIPQDSQHGGRAENLAIF